MNAPTLEARNLCLSFGGLAALSDVSITLRAGTVHALIGTNGAGKSTLIGVLAGELRPGSGTVTLGGTAITSWSPPRRAKAGLGRSYQRTSIFPELTVHENCRLAAQSSQQSLRDWFGTASRCGRSAEAADRALELTGLSKAAGHPAGTLSHGHKRQLEIAMAMANQPTVLLLDEPLAGMGAEETENMLGLLATLRKERAILLVEHDMDAVFSIADEITVMMDGRVMAGGPPAAIRENPDVRRAYLGEDT